MLKKGSFYVYSNSFILPKVTTAIVFICFNYVQVQAKNEVIYGVWPIRGIWKLLVTPKILNIMCFLYIQ